MKRLLFFELGTWVCVLGLGLSASGSAAAVNAETAAPRSADPEIEKRIESLLAKMTLEEKIGQMSQLSIGNDGRDRKSVV